VIQREFKVEGSPDIEVRIESGRIEVHRSDPNVVRVSVDTSAPGFIVEQRGNSILVSSDKTSSWLSRGSARVVIEAPEGSDLQVGVASAPVRVDVPLGKVDIKTASGDIELVEAEAIAIKTASGDADIGSVGHSLTFTSASGDLRVRGSCRGSVAASAASGDIHIADCEATVAVNTASGDIDIARFAGRSANFKGMSGDVDLAIPRRTEVDLDVNLLSGRLRLPEPEPSQGDPERQMSIRAKLVSGNLTIKRAD
jgi:DUF4097 and DUF4098 domain-containing protein YvlB